MPTDSIRGSSRRNSSPWQSSSNANIPPPKVISPNGDSGNPFKELITPRHDDGRAFGAMQYQRTPGAYFCSKKGTSAIYGLRLLNPSRALAELIEEVNRATPKQVFFFDSGFVLGEDNPYAVNWTDNRGCPTIIPIFLNPQRAIPEIVAHELMHSWIEFYAGLEDGREYFDQSNRPLANVVHVLQSVVLDCTVLWQLRKRGGFDLDVFRQDIVAQARENITPFRQGLMHATPFGQLVAVQALAVPTAFHDLYELTKEDKELLDELWKLCRSIEPVIARTAEKMTVALRRHGYDTESGIRASIDECLSIAFEFLCIRFDPDKDMVWKTVKMALVDKMPDYMPGCPVEVKHEALRDSIRSRRHILCSEFTPGKDVLVRFAPEGSRYSSLRLPAITRSKEAGKPSNLYFFPPGTTKQEMDELQPPESSLPYAPPDIYAHSYTLLIDSNRLHLEGASHVLHA